MHVYREQHVLYYGTRIKSSYTLYTKTEESTSILFRKRLTSPSAPHFTVDQSTEMLIDVLAPAMVRILDS
jgi:hypothetical protein